MADRAGPIGTAGGTDAASGSTAGAADGADSAASGLSGSAGGALDGAAGPSVAPGRAAASRARPAGSRRLRLLHGWAGRMAGAASFVAARPDTWVVAVAGFLVRGGFVLLILPVLVLPSPIALAGLVGQDAVTIAGQPTPWLYEVVAGAIVILLGWLLLAGVAGALVDAWLVAAATEGADVGADGGAEAAERGAAGADDRGGLLSNPGRSTVARLIAIRAICLVPLAAVLAWAGTRIYDEAYAQLTVPTDVSTPLLWRVAVAAGDAVAATVVAWLVCETVAAIATRRLLCGDGGIWRSIGGALAEAVGRPVSTLATLLLLLIASVVAVGAPLVATSIAFDWARIVARTQDPIALQISIAALHVTRDARPLLFVLAAAALAVAWLASLTIAALASAWRSAAFTLEVADALQRPTVLASPAGSGPADAPSMGLSSR